MAADAPCPACMGLATAPAIPSFVELLAATAGLDGLPKLERAGLVQLLLLALGGGAVVYLFFFRCGGAAARTASRRHRRNS
eukprot:6617226-Prymnesium_polylepis.1